MKMDVFDDFFGTIRALQGKEYIIEFGQYSGKSKLRTETMVLLPPEFDPTQPFMFRLTENVENGKTAHGYSDINKVLKK